MPTNRAGGGMGGAVLGGLLMIALQMLQRNGGLGNVLGRLQEQGYGREADSWVSSGENMPVPADVIEQIADLMHDTAFFIKDASGRYLVVNQSLVERHGLRSKSQMLPVFPVQ
jgi:hypothetical protein